MGADLLSFRCYVPFASVLRSLAVLVEPIAPIEPNEHRCPHPAVRTHEAHSSVGAAPGTNTSVPVLRQCSSGLDRPASFRRLSSPKTNSLQFTRVGLPAAILTPQPLQFRAGRVTLVQSSVGRVSGP